MERRSTELQLALEELLNTGNVYFQPGPNVEIRYPCFIYERTTAFQPTANDRNYLFRPGYQVMFINRDEPDPCMLEKVMQRFQNCHYDRHFISDNLHHDVFTIYY